jgi:hypothetical protein
MLFDRARLRAWLAWKDPIDVALDLVAELRVDIRVLQDASRKSPKRRRQCAERRVAQRNGRTAGRRRVRSAASAERPLSTTTGN